MFHRVLRSLTTATALLLAVAVNAQPAIVGGGLETGFGVHTLSGSLTGEVDAAMFGESEVERCAGFMATAPSHRFTLNDDMPNMILHLETYGIPGSLVVHGPGGMRCSGFPTENSPELEGPWPAGRYNLYVGTVSQYDWLSYSLYVAESQDQVPTEEMTILGILDPAADWGALDEVFYGTGGVGIATGFEEPEEAIRRTPLSGTLQIDPTVPSVLSFNGDFLVFVEASTLSPPHTDDCLGWVDTDPTYSLTLRSPASSLVLNVEAPTNPAMVVAGPIDDPAQEPAWYCTLGDGTSASLSSPWPAGTYLIWVGASSLSLDDFTFTIRSD